MKYNRTNTYLAISAGISIAGIVAFYIYINRKQKAKALSNIPMPLPVKNVITSEFGDRVHPVDGIEKFHNGIDIRGAVGDPVYAPADGRVSSIYTNDAGGNQLIIKHDNGYTTGYAHLSKYHVKSGDRVVKGQLIAEIGNTGKTTGSHLHLTLKDANGNYLNPINYFV